MKWLWQWSQLIQRWWWWIYEHSEDHWWFSYLILKQIALINNSINYDLTDLSLWNHDWAINQVEQKIHSCEYESLKKENNIMILTLSDLIF